LLLVRSALRRAAGLRRLHRQRGGATPARRPGVRGRRGRSAQGRVKAEKHATFKSGAIILVVGLAGAALLFRFVGSIAMFLALPFIAWGASRVFVDATHGAIATIGDKHLEEWEGKYYEFAGIHVRVYEVRDRLWFVADDVIKALHIEANARLLA